ncbi:GTPase domain-containing protein [Caldimonas tepidiphila]|uniref:GTPase domain-containing protein n=1 Tax=Caldimonas tepidiphila TaxID=2315841 RepID=UPI000E5B299B|nr:GTPase [Caldimonas tepidiphila]
MLWIAIPGALLLGKLIYDAVTGDEAPAPRVRTVLESNLERLRRELVQAQGRRVAVLGQPGAGKSSLLRRMSRNEVTPPPIVGVHTDATSWADSPGASLLCRWHDFVFADVPGYDTASHPADVMLESFPFDGFDAFVLVLRGKLHGADERMHARLACQGRPVVVVRSFAESLDGPEREAVRRDLQQRLVPGTPLVFASNRSGEGLQEVLARLG